MRLKKSRLVGTLILLSGAMVPGAGVLAGNNKPTPRPAPLIIQEQGSFEAGGTIITNPGTFNPYNPTPDGQTLHGDHLYAFYQIPTHPRKLPLVMLHGSDQFTKTWETTPDGREGYQNIFLRRGFGVYLVDQPRRGNAGRATVSSTVTETPNEQGLFGNFRLGIWPNFFPGVKFSHDPEALNQYWRQNTPNTAPFDLNVITSALKAMFDKTGPGIMITHSQGGGPGWYTAMATNKVRAVVSYEPGSNFPFPTGEVPPPIPSAFNGQSLAANEVPRSDFLKLTKIPIIIFYGDNIPDTPTAVPADIWRIRIVMARLWAQKLNKLGGDVTVVHLPEIGIRGNTHFAFSDLNNIQIADLLSKWLAKKRLDEYPRGSGDHLSQND